MTNTHGLHPVSKGGPPGWHTPRSAVRSRFKAAKQATLRRHAWWVHVWVEATKLQTETQLVLKSHEHQDDHGLYPHLCRNAPHWNHLSSSCMHVTWTHNFHACMQAWTAFWDKCHTRLVWAAPEKNSQNWKGRQSQSNCDFHIIRRTWCICMHACEWDTSCMQTRLRSQQLQSLPCSNHMLNLVLIYISHPCLWHTAVCQ